jgi:nitroimidazol reductase NimA-like FMN-containing flavoprotein (pyridoxamine 5'-phosphate oxidase superfamily)
MWIHELSRQECLDVLQRNNIARLACVEDGRPYIVPVSFNADGDYIYSFATVGQKIRWMRANPAVCLEVEEIEHRSHWTTVLVFGEYEELTNSAEHAAARQRAQELFGTRDRWWEPATAKTESHDPYAGVVYRIRMRRVSGRRASRTAPPPSTL